MNILKPVVVFVLLLFGGLPFGACRAGDTSPKVRYDEADKILSACGYCNGVGVPTENRKTLDDLWTALQDWTVEYFNAHPHATPDQFNTEALNVYGNRNYSAPVAAWALGPDLYGANAQYGEIGNVFLVGKRKGRSAVVWDIRHLPKQNTAKFPILAGWSLEAARDTCRTETPNGLLDSCGPLYGYLGRLPPDANGHIRFYVDATFAQEGETLGAQLSIWSWNGETAEPLLVMGYVYMMEDVDKRFTGNMLHIRRKDEFRTAFVNEPEVGRQMDWRIRVTPDGIEDLGATPTVPELDFVDQALASVLAGKASHSAMTPDVSAKLMALIEPIRQDKDFDGHIPLGELWDTSVQQNTRGAQVCFQTDALEALVFTLQRRNGKFFVSNLVVLPTKTGHDCPHDKP